MNLQTFSQNSCKQEKGTTPPPPPPPSPFVLCLMLFALFYRLLNNNEIETLEDGAFDGLPELRYL